MAGEDCFTNESLIMHSKTHSRFGPPQYRLLSPLLLTFLMAAVSHLQAADAVLAANSAPGTAALSTPPPETQTRRVVTDEKSQNLVLSDQEIRRAILTELLEAPNHSVAKKIKIEVSHGKVTLSGTAKTEKQQKEIVAIAARAVGAANVEDKIQLRSKK